MVAESRDWLSGLPATGNCAAGARDRAGGSGVLEGVFINNERAHLATGSLYAYSIGIINDTVQEST